MSPSRGRRHATTTLTTNNNNSSNSSSGGGGGGGGKTIAAAAALAASLSGRAPMMPGASTAKTMATAAATTTTTNANANAAASSSKNGPQLFLVLFDYVPVDETELALSAGDLITKISEEAGWMEGKNQTTGQIGWLSPAFVRPAAQK